MPTINFTEINFTVNGSVNIYIQESGQLVQFCQNGSIYLWWFSRGHVRLRTTEIVFLINAYIFMAIMRTTPSISGYKIFKFD